MHGVGVGGGMDRDGGDSHLLAGAVDAERDLAAIGDEDFLEHQARISSDWPNSTGCASAMQISLTVPARGARIWLMVFIASMRRSVAPSFTVSPTFTKGGLPGSGET